MKYQLLHLLPNWREVIFIPDELSGLSLSDNSSGSCGVTSDQLGQKSYVEIQMGKQWKVVPLSHFLKIPLRDILQKCLQGKHPWNPLNINIIDGYSFRINVVLIVCLMRKSAKTSRCALQTRFRLIFRTVGNGQELVLLEALSEEAE